MFDKICNKYLGGLVMFGAFDGISKNGDTTVIGKLESEIATYYVCGPVRYIKAK
jgi:hypothetical protein